MPFSLSPLVFALVTGVILLAALVLWLGLRRRPEGVAPLVGASHIELRQGWYQVNFRLVNRAPYALGGVSLRCISPRGARLLAPIISLSTKEGDFQTWSDPATDKAAKSMPLDFIVGPHEAQGTTPLAFEAHPTAWLFLAGSKPPGEILFELTLRDGEGKLYCYEVKSTPQEP